MVPENEAVVRRFMEELWSEGQLSVADELVAPDHRHHLGDDTLRGPDGIKEAVTWLRTAFSDLSFEVDDVISDGDRVVLRWTARGTHRGTFADVARRGVMSRGPDAIGSASALAGSLKRSCSLMEGRCTTSSPRRSHEPRGQRQVRMLRPPGSADLSLCHDDHAGATQGRGERSRCTAAGVAVAEDYQSAQPLHPNRGFGGSVQVLETGRPSSKGCRTSAPNSSLHRWTERSNGVSGTGTVTTWTGRLSRCVGSRSSSCATASSQKGGCTWSPSRPAAEISRQLYRSCTNLHPVRRTDARPATSGPRFVRGRPLIGRQRATGQRHERAQAARQYPGYGEVGGRTLEYE